MPKIRKYTRIFGNTGDTVVLLHGFISSSKYWSKLTPRLVNHGYRVLTIDLLGFGKAPKPDNIQYNYDDQINHINSVIDSLNIKTPFIVIGHSMGGLIAERYSIAYPKRVSSLILLNPPLYKSAEETRTVLRNTGYFYKFILDSRLRGLLWPILYIFSLGNISKHTNISRDRSLKNIIESPTIFSNLMSNNIKTMLLVGKKDRKEYQNNMLTADLNNNVALYLENVNHHAPRKNTDLVEKLIINFLN